MKNPVTTRSGNSYDKDSLYEYIRRDDRDPLTREKIKINEIYPNLALKKAIEYHKKLAYE